MLLFALFQMGLAGISEQRSQRSLRGAFQSLLGSGVGLGRGADGQPAPIAKGTPVALLEIPDLHLRKVVVEGTDSEQLKRGPGHLRSSHVPGQPGHAIIAGRRTTYGAPFGKLDLLRAGDNVTTITPYGRFEYRVREVSRLKPRKVERLEASTTGWLSLVTSDPAYTPTGALVVEAELQGDPSSAPDPPRLAGQAGAMTFTGNAGALVGVALSGTLLLAVLVVADTLYQRWRRWSTYLLTTPIILALLFAWMEGLVSILPSTL
jgi:sortase A